MNKTAIKNFAIWARNKLIADITYKAGLLGISDKAIKAPLPQSTRDVQFFDIGTKDPYSITGIEIEQRRKLAELIETKAKGTDYKTAYKAVVEEVAYTWFNRLIAIRFMEVNDYLPSRVRVLSSEAAGKAEPDLVTNPFDSDLEFTQAEKDRILELKHDNKLDELFRMLFIKQCNALNAILPELFEKTSDYTEFLLNVAFTDKDGVVYHLVNDIAEDDFNVSKEGQVEIIGWLYQYYNTEPKDEAFALLKKNVKITKERIPAATQLFTPDWIVRYMVENSLGRLWIEGHPNDALKSEWKYYLDEAEQEPDVQKQLEAIREEYKTIRPEDIKVIDPCMGSGHILVYAFDVLMQIYESCGYSQRDAAKSILENNLYGLDIDNRAYQLAYFAVMMKARQYNRRILNGETTCHVYAIQESNEINREHLKYFGAGMSDIERNTALNQMQYLLDTFIDAKEYGSILNVDTCDWLLLSQFVEGVDIKGQICMDSVGVEGTNDRICELVRIAETMAKKYDSVITNPPYMSVSNGKSKLIDYVQKHYINSKSDLFAVFIEKTITMLKKNRFTTMITQHAWMFLTSFEKLRKNMLVNTLINMVHHGSRAFEDIAGEVVQTTSFVFLNQFIGNYNGSYIRLTEYSSSEEKKNHLSDSSNLFLMKQAEYEMIPGVPVAYWASPKMLSTFRYDKLSTFANPRAGLQTNNNDLFVRHWTEVDMTKMNTNAQNSQVAAESKKKWFPYNKGGSYRRWYGNNELVLNWENHGRDIHEYNNIPMSYNGAPVRAKNYYFHESVTWSAISSGNFSARYCKEGFVFDTKGSSCFFDNDWSPYYFCAFLNSCVAQSLMSMLSPTLDYSVGAVSKLPIIIESNYRNKVCEIVLKNIDIAKQDWDSFETSWDFVRHPLLNSGIYKVEDSYDSTYFISTKISSAYSNMEALFNERFFQLKKNEEELNRIFIEIYGLEKELRAEVLESDITIRTAKLGRDISGLISYAVGCMLGRYSIDTEGLVYAGGEWDESKYSTLIPDKDNCIPITDEEYFSDDIVGRFVEFVKSVYGEETLEENLDFIAKALGNKGNTSREILRNYFLKDFFKDHCKTYQKRPIYWLYDSGKQDGFKALVYMHRYTEDTTGIVRADYLHKLQKVYEREMAHMQEVIDNSTNAREAAAAQKRKDKLAKQLKETKEYDEKIAHLALARIAIDLDDGVKVNYEKVQTDAEGNKLDVLAKI